jgi:DNA (cytosine-5)-methyltransferase 1
LVTLTILDLYCGEGGSAKGYATAGFTVTGIDTSRARLRHYPYRSHRADALTYALAHGHEYNLIHASPPCTGYSQGTVALIDRRERYDRLIAATRAVLDHIGVPYIIENVEGARKEMQAPLLLCGRMFSLGTHDTDGRYVVLDRHRLFETTLKLRAPMHPPHHRGKVTVAGAYDGARRDRHEAKHARAGGYTPHPTIQRALLDVPWMSPRGVELCIPPAYTHHLGKQAATLLQEV